MATATASAAANKMSSSLWSHLAYGSLSLAAVFWAISAASLSAFQADCKSNAYVAPFILNPIYNSAGLASVDGFSATVSPCATVFAKTWTAVALSAVVLLVTALATAAGCAPRARSAFCGLFAVCAALFVDQASQWVVAGQVYGYRRAPVAYRHGAICAGLAGTAASFLLMVVSFGCDAAPPPPPGSPRRAGVSCPFAALAGGGKGAGAACPHGALSA